LIAAHAVEKLEEKTIQEQMRQNERKKLALDHFASARRVLELFAISSPQLNTQ
jgi:hypothetical protein